MDLQWRQPAPPLTLQWRGPDARVLAALAAKDGAALPTLIGPPGPAGPGIVSGSITLSLPGGAGVLDWEETVAAAGVIPAHRLFLMPAPVSDAADTPPDMLSLVTVSAVAGTDRMTVTTTFSSPESGAILFNWSAA